MVDFKDISSVGYTRNVKIITEAAQQLNKEQGIAKATQFLSTCVTGLNPVQLFAICEGKASLARNSHYQVCVEWKENESSTCSSDSSDTI